VTRKSTEPPILLDGTRVVRYAMIDTRSPGAGMAGVVAGGVPIDLRIVDRLAIAEDLLDPGVFLLHCNDNWETVAAENYPDADAAQRTADEAYRDVRLKWTVFRALTESEAEEVETTRSFLREIATEFPSE
jgi:hypothetical protein